MKAEQLRALADRLDAGKSDADTLRFSEAVVLGKRGYQRAQIMTTSPIVMRLFNDVWNNRTEIAAALRALANMEDEAS